MIAKSFTICFHPIRQEQSVRFDFDSDKVEIYFYEYLKLNGYEIYQFIHEEFKYNMDESKLMKNNIYYQSIEKEQKTWFGLSKKTVSNLLILPHKDFFYAYQHGHYFYLFTKRKVNKDEFVNWLDLNFLERFSSFDDAYSGSNRDEIKLMDQEDYLIVTNHDSQKDFGVIGNPNIIGELIIKVKSLNLKNMVQF